MVSANSSAPGGGPCSAVYSGRPRSRIARSSTSAPLAAAPSRATCSAMRLVDAARSEPPRPTTRTGRAMESPSAVLGRAAYARRELGIGDRRRGTAHDPARAAHGRRAAAVDRHRVRADGRDHRDRGRRRAHAVPRMAGRVPGQPDNRDHAPTRRAAVAAMLMIGAVLAGYVYFVSLLLQNVQGLSPVETGLALVPATVTVVLTSTLLTRRLLARLAIKHVLLIGLGCMAAGQLWFAQLSPGSSYWAGVLPGLLFTALGIGFALPTASIAITSGVQGRDQGLAGALFTTSQQAGAAVGLAILATAAAARTAHAVGTSVAGALTDGYRLSFLIATGIALLAALLVAIQLRSRDCQEELDRQKAGQAGHAPVPPAETQLRKC